MSLKSVEFSFHVEDSNRDINHGRKGQRSEVLVTLSPTPSRPWMPLQEVGRKLLFFSSVIFSLSPSDQLLSCPV